MEELEKYGNGPQYRHYVTFQMGGTGAVIGTVCSVFVVLHLLGLACGLARFRGNGLD